jgi:replicative DNA helicase
MLIDQDAVLRAVEHVDDTMFYAERHRRIFRAMVTITERGSVVDPLTPGRLSRRGEPEASGWQDYIGFRRRGADVGQRRVSREIVREKGDPGG